MKQDNDPTAMIVTAACGLSFLVGIWYWVIL